MTTIEKLYAKVVSNPGVVLAFKDFERLIFATGFRLLRVRGSHKAYGHPKADRVLVIQPRGKEAKPYQVRQFLDMVEEYQLFVED